MSKNLSSFKSFTDDQSQAYLADHFPHGKMFANRHKPSSILYKIILSIGYWVRLFSGQLYTFVKNLDIDQADELLEEWEESVGIPDNIPRLTTLAERRTAVKRLISKIPVYNIDDGEVDEETTYEKYIEDLTGISVTIRTARVDGTGSVFAMSFPVNFGIGTARGDMKFIIEVPVDGEEQNNDFPLPFPVQFYEPSVPQATQDLLDTVLKRIIPSFCRWTYEAVF
jgi:hypothetical protein